MSRDRLLAMVKRQLAAQSRMLDRWADAGQAERNELWTNLHEPENDARALLEAVATEDQIMATAGDKANAAGADQQLQGPETMVSLGANPVPGLGAVNAATGNGGSHKAASPGDGGVALPGVQPPVNV